jgi:heme/copper-type cytochrome/quinol oxidase subunit 2
MNKKTKIELYWIIGVLVILVGSAVINYNLVGNISQGIAQPANPTDLSHMPANSTQIQVIGAQWSWTFVYPNGTKTVDNLTLQVNHTYVLVVSSIDVIHDLYIDQMGVQVYAVPGHNNTVAFTPTHVGHYKFECVEYCGELHYLMRGILTVVQ